MKRIAKRTLSAAIILAAVSSPLIANAEEGDVTFNGKVVASTCVLKGVNGTAQKTGVIVTLPDVNVGEFNKTSLLAGMTPFTLELENCNTATKQNASVHFEGPEAPNDPDVLRNTIDAPAGGASGVGIALFEDNGTDKISVKPGVYSAKQAIVNGDNALKFKVAYKATEGIALMSDGNVSAKAIFDIAYE
ncbi:fimbrial protein [Buttiauxella izardii]|uniref:Type 1 fimbrial protein n=1 Tax=Buttiauxella izardii TaxID=82991 RepID=A0A3A5JNP4_9ENTR|nr:fimbrial protein [Buttiauxella izardii]RJT19677.1 type 1 fimbrial protein [Buttiauxella izardii]